MVSQYDMLERLAAESAEMQVERAELEAECETLQKGLDLCKSYRGRKSTGTGDFPKMLSIYTLNRKVLTMGFSITRNLNTPKR